MTLAIYLIYYNYFILSLLLPENHHIYIESISFSCFCLDTTRLRLNWILDHLFHSMKSNRCTYHMHHHLPVRKVVQHLLYCSVMLYKSLPGDQLTDYHLKYNSESVRTLPLPPEGMKVSDNSLCLHLVVPIIYTTRASAAVPL